MRRFVSLGGGLVLLSSAMFVAAACGDEASEISPSPADASPDGAGDAAVSAVDASPPDAHAPADAEPPKITASLGATARILVTDEAVLAFFKEDDVIVRAADAPDCVAHVSSASKPSSNGGEITVGRPSDGGVPGPLVVTPASTELGWDYFAPEAAFPADQSVLVQVETAGTPAVPVSIPPMAVQTLRSPPAGTVTMTKPSAPPAVGTELVIPSSQDYELTWTVPAAPGDLRLFVNVVEIGSEQSRKEATIFCSYPLSQGSGKIPTSLLTEIHGRIAGTPKGNMFVGVGSHKEVALPEVSFIVQATRLNSSSLGPDNFPARLQ